MKRKFHQMASPSSGSGPLGNLPVALTLLLFTFELLSLCGVANSWKLCGVLYQDEGSNGEKFPMMEEQQVSNFEEEYVKADTVWNTTKSFGVEKNCFLTLCNDTHFSGECQSFSSGMSGLPPAFADSILSADCTCSSDCKCSDSKMRSTDCARGYLGGCNVCSPSYTDLRKSKRSFSEDLSKQITALKVRTGCTLTVYQEEDLEEDGTETVVGGTDDHYDWNGTIGSYECSCVPGTFVPAPKPPRSESYPVWIDLPESIENVSALIQKVGPHPGLQAALSSLKNKRSARNAYILTIGSTGAGKSSAINLLFDNPNVTAIGGMKSTTTDIHEFRIPVPVDELGIRNSELRVIDTPGLLDTRGIEQDAKFLATLDAYLSNHEELKSRIPNVVLIFHKFTDNRFNGVGSNFVKMLRGLDAFRDRITDESFSNVIFVLSHFCSETKSVTRKPNERLAQFKATIMDYSLFPKPISIAVAENKAADQDLPLVNGYYKLPNGDYYPKNLFDKIQKATISGGDAIGDAVIRTAFRDSDHFEITNKDFSLLEGGNKVSYYYNIMIAASLGVQNSTVSQLLETSWQNMDPQLQKEHQGTLQYLQKALNIRNIREMLDVPQTTVGILELFSALNHNKATIFLLEDALKLKAPVYPSNVVTGHSYNVFKDTPLPKSPFALGEKKNSEIGYLFPAAMTCNVEKQDVRIFKIIPTRDDYIQERLKGMGIQGNVSSAKFTGELKPGYSIQTESFTNNSCSITAVREIRTFELVLNDKPKLTPEFTKLLLSLPTYNQTDHESVTTWTDFFHDYGTHVVKSVYGGGAIEISLSSDKPCDDKMLETLFSVIQFAEDLVTIRSPNSTNALTSQEGGISHQLRFRGGDPIYHSSDLTKMLLDDASELLTKWKKSLRLNPIILTNMVRLVSLSDVTRKVGQQQNISSEIQRAASLYFNSSLVYIPLSQVPTGRTEIGPAEGYANLLELIMKQNEASNLRFEKMMEQMRNDAKAAEAKQERERNEQRIWEREQAAERAKEVKADREAQRISDEKRQNATMEMQKRQEQSEKEYRAMLAKQQSEMQSAQIAHSKQIQELMSKMSNPPRQPRCQLFGLFCL